MSWNFGQIWGLITELAALDRLKNRCHPFFSVAIDPIHFKFIGNKDMHIILNEFEFRPDRTTNYRVICPWTSKKYPHRLIMGKMVSPLFLVVFDPILLILAGNDSMHYSLDEFEFAWDLTSNYGVSQPSVSKKLMPPLFLGCYWSDPFFLNEVWHWHIGLRWVIIALWATCLI